MPTNQDETLQQRYARDHQDYLRTCGNMTAEQVADLQLQLNNALAGEVKALEELTKANEKIDQAWNLSHSLDHQGFIPGALDAWKRPVKQSLPYDFSGNPGASATQYCNGWNDSGGYWSAHAKDLQQRLTVAEQRLLKATDLVERLCSSAGNQPSVAAGYLRDILDILKPTESGASE